MYGSLILLVLAGTFFVIRRMQKRKEEFKDIENLKSSRSPVYDFYYRVKILEREYLSSPLIFSREVIKSKDKETHSAERFQIFSQELNQNFRKFLALELNFPAHIWSSQKTMNYLKKQRIPSELLERLQRMLFELDHTLSKKDELSDVLEEECRQNLLLCKELVDQITQHKAYR